MEETVNLKRPSELESELRSLVAEEAPGSLKPTLLNLVVASKKPADREPFLEALAGARPSRILSLSTGAREASAGVSARCTLDAGMRSVCFETIELGAPMGQPQEAEPVARALPEPVARALPEPLTSRFWGPLLVRELPTFFLYLAEPEFLETFLADCADHVDLAVIDSTRLGSIPPTPAMPTADLAWERLAWLRGLTARLFDDPASASLIPALSSVRLSGFPRAEAVLFGRWIASRLGSRMQGEPFSFSVENGWSASVNFEFSSGEKLSIRSADSSCTEAVEAACWQLFSLGNEERKAPETVVTHVPDDGRLLVGLVDYPYDDSVYRAAASLKFPE
jgi:hypothetical protein